MWTVNEKMEYETKIKPNEQWKRKEKKTNSKKTILVSPEGRRRNINIWCAKNKIHFIDFGYSVCKTQCILSHIAIEEENRRTKEKHKIKQSAVQCMLFWKYATADGDGDGDCDSGIETNKYRGVMYHMCNIRSDIMYVCL